jgi:exonuclease SbcC
MEDLQSLFGQFEKQQQQVEKQQQLCGKKLAEYEEISREYNHLYQGFIQSQAGILAQSLQEGEPCPVCGAVRHPKPAELSEEICTREELEKKKEAVDKKDQEAREQGLKAEGLLTSSNAMRQQLIEKADALLGEEELEAVKPLLEERLSKLLEEKERGEKELTGYEQGEEAYEKAQKQLPALSESQREMEDAVAKQRELQTGRAKDLEHIEENLQKLEKELLYKNEAEALAAIEEWNQKKDDLQKAKETAEKAVADYDKEMAAKKARQQTLEEQLRENQTKPCEELIKQRQNLQGDKQSIQEKRDHLYRRYENNQESGRQALKVWEKLSQVEERYVSILNLSDTVNGGLSGKDKIMLETYVQMTYFDRILNQANVRLLCMTDGQYELVRKREASNQKSQSGLELEVWDHYTGSVRSVHTLSGGEAFMASLALALGLSDEIQMRAGGIRLDTMFVDEGFGSLDEETLSKAIDVLAGLTEGNRLVGIISHVEELKQRIDKQIVVKKDAVTGSRVEVSI